MKKHLKIFIEGQLEKADFNYYCQTGAIKHKIDAVYRNGDTRHVYIEAEGIDEDLQNYVEYLSTGALKKHMEIFRTEEGNLKDIKGFTSLREKKQGFKLSQKFSKLFHK